MRTNREKLTDKSAYLTFGCQLSNRIASKLVKRQRLGKQLRHGIKMPHCLNGFAYDII
jgi:hypothetical protein